MAGFIKEIIILTVVCSVVLFIVVGCIHTSVKLTALNKKVRDDPDDCDDWGM